MKLTNKDVLSVLKGLHGIAPYITDVALSFHVAQCIGRLRPIQEAMAEAEKQLLENHVSRDDDGQMIRHGDGFALNDGTKYHEELQKLFHVETEVDIEPLPDMADKVKAEGGDMPLATALVLLEPIR